jgi:hypothetical protein
VAYGYCSLPPKLLQALAHKNFSFRGQKTFRVQILHNVSMMLEGQSVRRWTTARDICTEEGSRSSQASVQIMINMHRGALCQKVVRHTKSADSVSGRLNMVAVANGTIPALQCITRRWLQVGSNHSPSFACTEPEAPRANLGYLLSWYLL